MTAIIGFVFGYLSALPIGFVLGHVLKEKTCK